VAIAVWAAFLAASNPAGATANVLGLSPASVTVPADGSIQGGVTATVTNSGIPVSGVSVTVTGETDTGTGHSSSCTTDSNGECLILTNHDTTVESGTLSASAPGTTTQNTTVNFVAPGSPATGLTLNVSNGNGASAPLPAGDTFSNGNQYLIDESSGHPANYDATQSEAVISAPLSGATGNEPWAINWTIHNTGATPLFLDGVASVAAFPATTFVCTSTTQTDGAKSPSCTSTSFDLDTNSHFSNPANPGLNGLGTSNSSLSAGMTVLSAGSQSSFTSYMTGANNNSQIVLDSGNGQSSSAIVSAQSASDPAGSTVEGAVIGSSTSVHLAWAALPSGTSITGTLAGFDGNSSGEASETGTPDPSHDWVALSVGGSSVLANFDQTASQTYEVNGTSASEATIETDLTSMTFAAFQATNYGGWPSPR
jgi:hypothetical protein